MARWPLLSASRNTSWMKRRMEVEVSSAVQRAAVQSSTPSAPQ